VLDKADHTPLFSQRIVSQIYGPIEWLYTSSY